MMQKPIAMGGGGGSNDEGSGWRHHLDVHKRRICILYNLKLYKLFKWILHFQEFFKFNVENL